MSSNTEAVLKGFIERLERLDAEKTAIADDMKEVFAEAKATGFNTKAMRRVLAIRKMDPDKRRELTSDIAIYMKALGEEDDGEALA